MKKSASGRLAVKGGTWSQSYTDRRWFKSSEAVIEHYKALADKSIRMHQAEIEKTEKFKTKCDDYVLSLDPMVNRMALPSS